MAPQEKYEYSYSFDNQVPAPSVTPKAEPVPAASGGGACGEVGGKCSGDLTFYEAGLGACGDTNNGNTEAVFALAHGMLKANSPIATAKNDWRLIAFLKLGMMGTQSNGNPYCGRTATITANGKSVVAKLVDKCMGCVSSPSFQKMRRSLTQINRRGNPSISHTLQSIRSWTAPRAGCTTSNGGSTTKSRYLGDDH